MTRSVAAGRMRAVQMLVWVSLALVPVTARAQTATAAPPLIPCGTQADLEVICGVRAPEDLELTPDGRHLIASQYASFRNPGTNTDLLLLDVRTRKTQPLEVTYTPAAGWGDPSCARPTALAPHGMSLVRRRNGPWELFVVNHAMRESIEMYELIEQRGTWRLVWHGCMVSALAFNDVAGLADGSFVGTHPTALIRPEAPPSNPLAGGPTGWVAKWSAAAGETELPGTRLPYPNGVNASADGRYLYINAFSSRSVHKYEVAAAKVVAMVNVEFNPDNLTWTRRGDLIAAGVKGARGNCPPDSNIPCIMAFGVARIDPDRMSATPLFDSGQRPIISGVSVAIEAGTDLYVGAFEGDRVVRMAMPSTPRTATAR